MGRIKEYAELKKDEMDIHPQTGESKFGIRLDLYLFNDDPETVVVWGWGTYRIMRGHSIDVVCDNLAEEGFEILERML